MMSQLKYLILIIYLFPIFLFAQNKEEIRFLSSLNLGVRYSSVLQNRGIILYNDYQVDPVVGLFFLNDQIEFVGDSLGYKKFIYEDQLRVRTRIISLTDQPLFPKNEKYQNKIISRKDTYEWSNSLEFFGLGYNKNYKYEVNFTLAKDLLAHLGLYSEVALKVKLFEFRLPRYNTLIEPNFYISYGWGDERHNKYLYGPSTDGGLNNRALGLWFAFPEESDRFYPIIQMKYFETIATRQNNEYSKFGTSGFLISFIATYGVLPL